MDSSPFLMYSSTPRFILFNLWFACYSGYSGTWATDNKAFIFSLVNKEELEPFKSMVKNPSRALYRSTSYGPYFGSSDILISSNANSNTYSYANLGNSYSLPSGVKSSSSVLAGTYNFTPDEVEVFYLL